MKQSARSYAPILITAILILSQITLIIHAPPGSGDLHIIDPEDIPPDLSYAVFTNGDLMNSFEPLAEWRSMTGLRAGIFRIDGDYGVLSGEGSDDAEKLFNFISDLYETTGGNLSYVLLGGDSEIVPYRFLRANASSYGLDDEYVSDVYYSAPTMIWDGDGDGLYGTPADIEMYGSENINLDLNVGRIPINTIQEADLYVNRVIEYEISPAPGNWTGRALLASTLMERPNILNDPGTEEDEGFDPWEDNGYKSIERLHSQIPSYLDVTDLYDYKQYYGMNYSAENDTLGYNSIPLNLSKGAAIFTFAGQSYYDIDSGLVPGLAYSLAEWLDPSGIQNGSGGFFPAFNYEDSYNLTNDNMLPMVYISSCDSFNFTDTGDRDLENIMYAPGGGAICAVGSTGVSWRGEWEGFDQGAGNWYLMPRYWEKVFDTNMPGGSLYDLKEEYLHNFYGSLNLTERILVEVYTYNYFGDPALRGWVGQPRDMVVTLPSESIHAGDQIITISVENPVGSPIYNAVVSIYNNVTGEVFSGSTNAEGTAEIHCSFSSGGSGKITVTARNRLPVILNTTILRKPVDVAVIPDSIDIQGSPYTEGREIIVSFEIENSGGEDAESVQAGVITEIIEPGDELIDPIVYKNLSLSIGEKIELNFTLDPIHSWTAITPFVAPLGGELSILNNFVSIPVHVNARPAFLPIDPIVMEEDNLTHNWIDIGKYVFDPDNDTGEMEFGSSASTPEWIDVGDDGIVYLDPPANWSGTQRIFVTVWDGLAVGESYIDLTITPVNDPPVLNNILDSYDLFADRPFVLELDIADAEGDLVTIEIDSDLGNLSVTGNELRIIPYAEDIGTHNVTLRAVDPSGNSTSYHFQLIISPPDDTLFFSNPSIHLPDARVGRGYSHRVEIGGALSEDAVFSDNTTLFDIDPNTGVIEFTPSDDDAGEHWVLIEVSSGNVSINRAFIFRVKEDSPPPYTIYAAIGGAIVVLIILLAVVYIWSGKKPEQYGLEE